ncbi:MAG: PRC-barrel domain-containing protein, partial [Sphingomonadaceae bacterium]
MATTASGHTTLIASDKVEGTAVYNRQGEKLGSVYNLM